MKRLLTLVLTLLTSAVSTAAGKTALVVIAYGAPMPAWNQPVLALEEEIRGILHETGENPFAEVRVAMMEFTEPSINTVVTELEKTGITRIYALPLFIAPSGHSLYDVPTILGLYYDAEIAEELRAEGTTLVDSRVRITLGPVLFYGGILKQIMLDRVEDISTEPAREGLLILAHGDSAYEPIWEGLCHDVGTFICAKTGISRFDYAFVGVGQQMQTEGIGAILGVAEEVERTLVVGMYISLSAEDLVSSPMMGHRPEGGLLPPGLDIRLSDHPLLPDPRIAEWIVKTGLEWAAELP